MWYVTRSASTPGVGENVDQVFASSTGSWSGTYRIFRICARHAASLAVFCFGVKSVAGFSGRTAAPTPPKCPPGAGAIPSRKAEGAGAVGATGVCDQPNPAPNPTLKPSPATKTRKLVIPPSRFPQTTLYQFSSLPLRTHHSNKAVQGRRLIRDGSHADLPDCAKSLLRLSL